MLFLPSKGMFLFQLRFKSILIFFLGITSFFWTFGDGYGQNTITKTFNSDGTFTLTDLSDLPGFDPNNEIFQVATVDLLIVGGGGAGGDLGGGGGGEVKLVSIDLDLGAQLTITIGTGGISSGSVNAANGNPTTVTLTSESVSTTYQALGGGRGGYLPSGNNSARNGESGGSGGGGGARNGNSLSQRTLGIGGTTGIGVGGGVSYSNNGSNGYISSSGLTYAGGGGGGAGGNGTAGTAVGIGGNGGEGISFPQFTGIFSAGGGGFGINGNGTSGTGSGGSGSGGDARSNGFDGIVIVQIVYQILPVEFSKFDVYYNNNLRSTNIFWETLKEWENSHFQIERSINSIGNWETIARIEGNGYSDGSIEYSYEDIKLPPAGGNIFYRIKQVDFSGSTTYTETKSIKVEPLPGSANWILYPNPTTGYPFNIEILDQSTYRDEPITLRVITPTGQYKLINFDELRNMGTQVSQFFENKASGVYTIEISWGNNREYHKVILRK
ncbi:glycine-rich domain-containing protein [Algoriphagus sp. SE2]|uniref:glycine-rich domain-containing protein n=1 Tax=Algoriphagus sp. SE2 TaxID=3141536 RepID=UPI0031CD30C8